MDAGPPNLGGAGDSVEDARSFGGDHDRGVSIGDEPAGVQGWSDAVMNEQSAGWRHVVQWDGWEIPDSGKLDTLFVYSHCEPFFAYQLPSVLGSLFYFVMSSGLTGFSPGARMQRT
jgi:hypothetical protein